MAQYIALQDPPDGELIESSPLLGDTDALRSRYDRDGYLFFRGLLEADAALTVGHDIGRTLAGHGWCRPGSSEAAWIAAGKPLLEGQRPFNKVYDVVQRLERFHELGHAAALMATVGALYDGPIYVHPLKIARILFPNAPHFTTPEHQDFLNNQGTRDLCAAWIPIVECPESVGGLAVLEGSHHFGVLPLAFCMGAGLSRAVLDDRFDGLRWLSTDYRPGDVLLFHSLTVHRALPNRSGSRMRLSVDFRYTETTAPVTPHCLEPHGGRISWAQVYENWQSDQYQYYWKALNLEVVPADLSHHRAAERPQVTPDIAEVLRDMEPIAIFKR